jgi:hydrophobic/amphiphilic exporter-1 (mainly G- bacteria), HAE1 family
MNIVEPFIRRPVMTTLVMLAILLFGILGYRSLAVSDLPNVDYPTIQVSAGLPGANPDTMASAVATPLEKQFSTIAGIDSMTSSSSMGSSQITLQFDLSRNIDAAAQDVQAAIARAAPQLPPTMPTPPTYNKVNPADQPIMYMALGSQTLPLYVVDKYAETLLAQRISMVKGVAQVQVYGSQKYAVRIELDPQAMASRQIGIDQVETAVQNANVNLPVGTLYGPHQAFTLEANGQLTQASYYRPLIVAYSNGSPVRLEDLGKVLDSVQNDKIMNWWNDTRSVVLAVQRQPGTNTVEVVDAIKQLLPQFRDIIPPAIAMRTLYDRSISIRESVDDVKFTLFLAVLLVVLVIFLFLRNLSATLIPSFALPMSIIGTFAVMYELNYTIDNLSLMALTLSVGFVVDDAIVMLENIVRHMEMGEGVMEAALSGSREIGFTILSMTLSLAAVFIPVLFLGGIIGRLLHEFSVVIIMAILVSGLVSLTLTPMLCSRFLRSQHEAKHGRTYMVLERFFDRLLHRYDVTLQWALRHRVTVMGISALILFITAWQFYVIPKGFLPEVDAGQIFAFTEAQQGISFDSMVEHQEQLNKIAMSDPNRLDFFSSVGGGAGASNNGILFLHLKAPKERPKIPSQTMLNLEQKYHDTPVLGSAIRALAPLFDHHPDINEVMTELRPKFAAVTGMNVYMQNPPPIRIGGQLTKSLYQLTLQSPDTAELYRVVNPFAEKMAQLPGLRDVTSDLLIKNPQVLVNIDRDKASALGVNAQQVEDALYTAYGQRQISTIYAPNDEFWVVMALEDKYQRDPAALSMLYIRSSSGTLVPLNAVASLTPTLGPLTVNHLGQLPAVTVSFNLKPGAAIGDAVNEINQLVRTDLPATVTSQFQGSAQAFESSFAGMGILLVLAILVIYIVLGILYESFIHPITILSGLPSAAFGALLTLQIFGLSLDLYAFVGVIMLIGIVKKNAIMMVDFAIAREREGNKSAAEAIYEGSLVRFRPIMMTTMAALMGTLPIAVGSGMGADSRRPLGLAVVGGLVFSQLVTLYLTPVFYTYMDSFQEFLGRRFGKLGGKGNQRLADGSASAD